MDDLDRSGPYDPEELARLRALGEDLRAGQMELDLRRGRGTLHLGPGEGFERWVGQEEFDDLRHGAHGSSVCQEIASAAPSRHLVVRGTRAYREPKTIP